MWLRIGDKDFPKSSIKEIYRMGKTIQSLQSVALCSL